MLIHPALEKAGYFMNAEQKDIVAHKRGPLLVIAGPGSGKTRSLALLTMNLLLCEEAKPIEVVLCTYTEKAAYELQDRLTVIARDVHYTDDLSRLKVGTIHGICQQLVTEQLHHTSLSDGYEVLDQFTQQLLIFNHLGEICSEAFPFWQNRCPILWKLAKELKDFFDAVAEELVFEQLQANLAHLEHNQTSKGKLFYQIACAYKRYCGVLAKTNSVDFAHLQKWAHKLLSQPETCQKITSGIRYVLVDEYQDTNYIQEQLLILLASGSEPQNLIVIGDEDQALYRFRGATVRNIRTFAETFPDCSELRLTTNYRSHLEIVQACNQWIRDFDWSNQGGAPLRTEKSMCANRNESRLVPSVMHLDARDFQDEAEQLAELVAELKEHKKITDYSDVALLLYSVKAETSQPYIHALEERGISVYCPRAGTFFRRAEILLLFGCLARFLRYSGKKAGSSRDDAAFSDYLTYCAQELDQFCQRFSSFKRELQNIDDKLQSAFARGERSGGQYLLKTFYQLLFSEHVFPLLAEDSRRANLVRFSRLLETFQKQYGPTIGGLNELRQVFFERFFSFLYQEGMSEEEDQQRPFLPGHVQVMTIHQAKGLEFPVVLVGGLDRLPYLRPKEERLLLQLYTQRPAFEPKGLIARCDLKRLYYVALSRAKDLLVLSSVRKPANDFLKLWQESAVWQEKRAQIAHFPEYKSHKEHELAKPRYGVTTHIQTYQTCPRRYSYFYEHRFAPSQPPNVFLGQLVHQTIEQIHRQVLTHTLDEFDEGLVRKTFNKTYVKLQYTSLSSITEEQKEQACRQVLNYYRQNQREMQSIRNIEFPVQIDREAYVLRGKIDLLVNGEQGLEVIDFKARERPVQDTASVAFYKQQLQLYAYALQKHTGQLPQHLWLYWTAEEQKADALMEVSCDRNEVERVIFSVDEVAFKIQQKQFEVRTRPADHICRTCDIRTFCKKEGVI